MSHAHGDAVYLPLSSSDRRLGGLLALTTLFVLMATDQMGFTRDDTFYFHAARTYAGWFQEMGAHFRAGEFLAPFRQESIDRHLSYNAEHPFLIKGLFALSWLLFFETLGWLPESLAIRLPGMVFAALGVALTFRFATEVTGRRVAGVVAALGFVLMPRPFFHAHLACFDIPITTLWVAVIYAWWRSFASRRWALWTGVLWGIALSTKLNAFFLPFVLLAHLAIVRLRDPALRGGTLWARVRPPLALWSMALWGPLLFFGLWPRHWYNTVDRLTWYLNFHLKHEHYHIDYFGRFLIEPPFPVTFPFVMTAVTTPLVVLFLWLWGLVRWWDTTPPGARDDLPGGPQRETGWLLALGSLVPFAVIAMPSSPIFGGIKHWMTALPLLMIVAAWGFVDLVDRLKTALPEAWPREALARGALLTLLFTPLIHATYQSHPFGLAYYNEVIGGVTGAADRGMMRNYWGYSSRQALPWVNEHARQGAYLQVHNMTRIAFDQYQGEEMLRRDLRWTNNVEIAHFVLYHHPKNHLPANLPNLWERLGTQAPAHVVHYHGVPLLSIYRNTYREPARAP